MEKDTEITQEPTSNPNFDKNGKFKKGNKIGELGGRKFGTRDWNTDFDEVIADIAKDNNLPISEVRKVLLKVAYKRAKDGDFSFSKDINDRVYGKALQINELRGKGGKDLIPETITEKDKKALLGLIGK